MKNNPEMLPCRFCKNTEPRAREECDEIIVECQNCEASAWLDIWNSRTQPSVQGGGDGELRNFAETMLEVTSKYSMLHASAVRLGAELALGLEPTKVPHFAKPEPTISVNMFGSTELLEELRAVAAAIHYPECWDTATYPTLADAAKEIGCNPADYTHLTTTEKGCSDE